MRLPIFLLITALFFNADCAEDENQKDPLLTALASSDPRIKKVMSDPRTYELQVLFSRIDRQSNPPVFTDYGFQVKREHYFYPASTVKLPVAVLAMEKLNEVDTLGLQTRFFVEGDTTLTTFASDILRIFAVSDNEANNRLMEFLGQDAINLGLSEKDVGPVRISHRLGVHSDEVTTQPLLVYLNDSTIAPTKPIVNTVPKPLILEKIKKGKGHYDGDSLYMKPFDFSLKNYYPLETQQAVLKRIIFPEAFEKEKQFNINEEQRSFLLNAMQILPRDAGYDESEFYDSYCKFFMFGDQRDRIPAHIKIYNKVGFAYGTLTDCAYISDMENGVEFLLSATILVNSDGIFNDDLYEYDEIGIPFLAALGRELYNLERQQKN